MRSLLADLDLHRGAGLVEHLDRRADARKVLDDVQAAPVAAPEINEKWITVPAEAGDVRVRIVKPAGTAGTRWGPSPRVRGARLNDKGLQDVVGTILACAGSAVPS